ncbi:MAG: AAA family ATPase, partial [Planctomycetes bacterium]|nr:AAA family ATPase [Planctomycetota bacterium]
MKCITVINQKGGVGKTTTAANLGVALARRARRVLLIDLDPQAHLTIHLGVEPEGDQPNSYMLLTLQQSIADIRRTVEERLC